MNKDKIEFYRKMLDFMHDEEIEKIFEEIEKQLREEREKEKNGRN